MLYWDCQMKCSKCPPALFTLACERLRKFWAAFATGFWGSSFQICNVFKVPQSLMAFSLACGRLLAWRPTRDSQQQGPSHHARFCSHNVWIRSLSSSETLCMLLTLNELHLEFIEQKLTTCAKVLFFTNFTSQWRHVVFGSWFHVFSADPRGCKFRCYKSAWLHVPGCWSNDQQPGTCPHVVSPQTRRPTHGRLCFSSPTSRPGGGCMWRHAVVIDYIYVYIYITTSVAFRQLFLQF